jgi:four helix bundle protein
VQFLQHLVALSLDSSTIQRARHPHLYCGMANNGSFRDLKVWRDSMTLVEDVYRITSKFPPDERFGLTAQVRRASVSIPSNIGEGKRRKRQRAFLHHLDIALGSQGEVEVQLEIAFRLGYVGEREFRRVSARAAEVGRMLNGLIESMQPTDVDW